MEFEDPRANVSEKEVRAKNAVHFLLDSRDLAVNLRGAAGTGKTATLQELRRGLREAGRRVLAVAPTMSAVEELQKVGFASAISLEKLLQDQQAHRELRGNVVIVDEAGMISGNQMAQLLRLAERQSVLAKLAELLADASRISES